LNQSLTLDPKRIKPFAQQPRKRFKGIKQLATSINAIGQETPVIVIPIEDPEYSHELIDGERRLRACLLLNRSIEVIVKSSKINQFAHSVAANFCRQPHDAMEVCEAIQHMKSEGMTIPEISAVFGKSDSWISQHLSLNNLAPELKKQLENADSGKKRERRQRGRLNYSLAISLSSLVHEEQIKILEHIQSKQLSLPAARNYIRAIVLDSKTKDLVRPGSRITRPILPSYQWETLVNALDNFQPTMARYTSQTRDKLTQVFEVAGKSKLELVEAKLKEIAKEVEHVLREVQHHVKQNSRRTSY